MCWHALAEGLGIRGTAQVFEVAPNTVLEWLVEAADQFQSFSAYFLHDFYTYNLLYVSAQLTWWHTLTGTMVVESRQLIAH